MTRAAHRENNLVEGRSAWISLYWERPEASDVSESSSRRHVSDPGEDSSLEIGPRLLIGRQHGQQVCEPAESFVRQIVKLIAEICSLDQTRPLE